MVYAPWGLAALLLVLYLMRSMQLSEAEAELARLKGQQARGQGWGGFEGASDKPALEAGEWHDEVKRLVQQGQKIQAIKLYREKTGLGLKEAKDAVDALG